MNLIGLRAFKIKFLVAMGLLLSSVILLIVLSPNDQRETVGNITNPIAINIAVILSIIILFKQKLDGDLGRAFLSLFIGLILWGTAEVLFSYDEIVTNDIGNITISDFLWLMGYGPLIYFGTKMYTLFHSFSSRKSIILVSVIMVAYIIYLLPFMISTYNESQLEDLPLLYVRLSYVILDLIFIYPAALVILNSEILKGKLGDLYFLPWMFFSMIVIGIADSVFAYTSVSGNEQLEWITTPIYTSGYLLMGFGLYWHYKFFVYKGKLVSI